MSDTLQRIADRVESILSECDCEDDAAAVLALVVAETLGGDPRKMLHWISSFADVVADRLPE